MSEPSGQVTLLKSCDAGVSQVSNPLQLFPPVSSPAAFVHGQWRKVLGISTFFARTISDEEAAAHARQRGAKGWVTKARTAN